MSHPKTEPPPQQQQQPDTTIQAPDPEVVPKAKRRQYTAEYKLRILEEADACTTEPGQIGSLLRREGLYSSNLTRWRRLREQGQLQALGAKRRGPKSGPVTEELARLRQANTELKARLERAEIVIGVQKKLSQLLGLWPGETQTNGVN